MLVLVGSDDPALADRLDLIATQAATVLDIRTGVLWTEVPDGLAFLEDTLNEIQTERERVRFAVANPISTPDELVRMALMAPTLDQLANAHERAVLAADPPTYEVRYQPVVRLKDRTTVGFESLMRAHAGGVRVGAEELLARAARGGWSNELDQLGRTLALRGLGPWLGQGLLFLNVMAPDGTFDTAAVRATIQAAAAAGIDPDQIVLEAVERNRYADLNEATAQIEELRGLGVRIAVDDVGDGFSSLRVVAAFKPDIIKIAGDLVAELPSTEAVAIITALVTLAHDSGSWVVAENIETEEQAAHLTRLGVDWGQGLHLGPPSSRQAGELADR